MSTKGVIVFLALIAIFQHASASSKLTTCQKAYFMLRQCASEMVESRNAGPQCCELLEAFDVRDCIRVDAALQSFVPKTVTTLLPLRQDCGMETPAAPAYEGEEEHDIVLEEAALEMSKAKRGDSSMVKDVMSIAQAVLASETDAPSRTVAVDVALDGDSKKLNKKVKSAVATAIKTAGKVRDVSGGVLLLQDISVTLEEEEDVQTGLCACENAELREIEAGPSPSFMASLRYGYLATRLTLCKFSCAHKRLVLGGLILQMALLGGWMICLIARPRWLFSSSSSSSKYSSRKSSSRSSAAGQFVVDASDAEWLRQPLLADEEAGIAAAAATDEQR